MSTNRFKIAFSFAGEKREFVHKVAHIIAGHFGEEAVLYDKFHEAEFARYDLGIYLPKLYGEQADLVVPVLCANYQKKLWTGWEWIRIYSLLTKGEGYRVMPSRFECANADGLSPASGFVELDNKTPEQFATLILERLAINEGRRKDFYAVTSELKQGHSSETTSSIPQEFRCFIADKTQGFVGRVYVFNEIKRFLLHHSKGYFIIQGDPGAGKSAILAEYVRKNPCIIHFNIRAEGITSTRQFLDSVEGQLSALFGVSAASDKASTDGGSRLAKLLEGTRERLGENKKLIIGVDALDEVDQSDQQTGANILYLPITLQDGVYFILTRRRLTSGDLPFVTNAPQHILDLNDFQKESIEDIHIFLRQAAQHHGIESWISARNLSLDNFIETLANKSECNFIYLHYVLAEIGQGDYNDVSLSQLPLGLDAYYEDHWHRMDVHATPASNLRLFILYILCESLEPISRSLLADFARQGNSKPDEVAVQEVLNAWHQFLHKRISDGTPRYSIYHLSFREFLHRKEILSAAGVSLSCINGVIAANLSKTFPDEEDF